MKFRKLNLALVLIFLFSTSIAFTTAFSDSTDFNEELNNYPADNYADEVIDGSSFFYIDGDNALGAPDGVYAKIFLDYANGQMTFDLGRYEIAVDSAGDDLTVHINNGTYIIKIGNSLSSPLTTVGQANTTESFDIDSVGYSEVRYVQIQYISGAFVELDAIEVINLLTPTTDLIDPNVDNPADLWVWENETSVEIVWSVSDATPWNYSITVDDSLILIEEWDDITITYDLPVSILGNTSVVLTLWDFFGNTVNDEVIVEIRPLPTEENVFALFAILPLALMLVIRRKRNKNL